MASDGGATGAPDRSRQVEQQRAFYDAREHHHLRPREDDAFAENLAAHLARAVGMGPGQRVLEVGAGFGRFTFPLLERCGEIVAVDLSPRVLADLESARDARGVGPERCRVLQSDVDALSTDALGGPADCVAGFFFLHHLPDFAHTLRVLRPLLAPGGHIAFVEPNRRNPLFLAQVIACPDMTWREERGMFALSARKVETAYRDAGFEDVRTWRFGCFPPQIFNRSRSARRLEAWLEARGALRPILPFLLLTARAA